MRTERRQTTVNYMISVGEGPTDVVRWRQGGMRMRLGMRSREEGASRCRVWWHKKRTGREKQARDEGIRNGSWRSRCSENYSNGWSVESILSRCHTYS